MEEIGHQRILRGFGVLLSFSLFFLGPNPEALTQPSSDSSALQGSLGEQEETEPPRKQTFYKWIDDNGTLFFTDDLAKVPVRFKDRLETFELVLPSEERETGSEPKPQEGQPPSRPITEETEKEPQKQDQGVPDSYVYKEVPFDQFVRITVGMDEAEVLSRLGFPSLVTPSDYVYGGRGRYKHRIIRLIYLGDRELNQKTTVVEIRNGRVVNVERIFPF